MTNIFSSKSQAMAELKADNEKLNKSVSELTAKLEGIKPQSEDIAAIKAAFETEKSGFNTTIETMKAEFSNEVNSLKAQLAELAKVKAEVETKAKIEVEKAKEIKKEEVKAQVQEGVAAKVASMGIKESELPPVSNIAQRDRFRIIRYNEDKQ